jgi:hypothetical protein
LSFYYLTSNGKISCERTEDELEETKEGILKVADSILKREFQATKGFHCDWCDYKPICPASPPRVLAGVGQKRGEMRPICSSRVHLRRWLLSSSGISK